MNNPPKCHLPDGTIISPRETGEINDLNGLTKKAKTAYVHPALNSTSLISIGQLCDDNCTAIFNKDNLKITKNNRTILKGYRNRNDGLWDIPLMPKHQNSVQINAIIKKMLQKLN